MAGEGRKDAKDFQFDVSCQTQECFATKWLFVK